MSIAARLVAAGLLFWALARHRYDYYVLLRWITFAAAAYSAFLAKAQTKALWALILAAVAVLFNPIVPVHLRRDTWSFVDVATAVLLITSIAAVRERSQRGESGTR